MKKLLIVVLLIGFGLIAKSQNGGQFANNNVVKVEYVGSLGGNVNFLVTSNQPCSSNYRVNYLNFDTTITIDAFASKMFTFNASTLTSVEFKAKVESANVSCVNQPDMGWVEVTGAVVLPIKFSSIKAKQIDKETIQVDFTVEESEGTNLYYITLSKDGKNFKRVGIVFPENTQSNKTYTIKIKL